MIMCVRVSARRLGTFRTLKKNTYKILGIPRNIPIPTAGCLLGWREPIFSGERLQTTMENHGKSTHIMMMGTSPN